MFFCSISFFYTQGNKGTRQRQYEINSYTGQFLHQSRVEFKINFVLYSQFEYKTSLCFTDQETQKEIFGGTSSLVGQFLHPSPVQSSRSIQRMQKVQLFLSIFFLSCASNLDMGPLYASEIKKLRQRFLVEPAPLWASSYTHLLYKAQDPFSASRQSNCP